MTINKGYRINEDWPIKGGCHENCTHNPPDSESQVKYFYTFTINFCDKLKKEICETFK